MSDKDTFNGILRNAIETKLNMANRAPDKSDAGQNAANFLRPIKARTRDMEVIDALIGMIEAAGLKVGDQLPPENELAKRLGVGRSTIREAMKSWQSMGIVVRNKGAGTILAAEVSSNSIHVPLTLKLEAESLLRTHAVRRPLEIEASRLAALNASTSDKEAIGRLSERLLAVHASGGDWREADAHYHAAIHQASGNPLFGQLISQLQNAFHSIYDAPFGDVYLGESSIPVHAELTRAILAGNADEAARVMLEISGFVEDEVKAYINEA
ncbi:FadR/GntR family transcriptional regulator [Roseibium sp.]|uniref:FadR/GntR family transcriptional regulator n=1 Tax=Roseibium sp. TaxID=1936156 RepID=UPI003B51ACD9